MGNLAHALDTWNNGFLIKEKLPPRNKQGLKAYTKGYGEKAKEFGLLDIRFNDVIGAYRSLPYSLPEFQSFSIPENAKPLLEGIADKTSAIAAILDYALKDGKPELIYREDHPYSRHADLLLAYREMGLELFPKSTTFNHLFPSVAVMWGCLLIGEIRLMLDDSGCSDLMFGEMLPHAGFSKRAIERQTTDSLDALQGSYRNQKKTAHPIGSDPYIIFWKELKQFSNKKKTTSSPNTENLCKKIKKLRQTIKNDPNCKFHWIDEGILKST